MFQRTWFTTARKVGEELMKNREGTTLDQTLPARWPPEPMAETQQALPPARAVAVRRRTVGAVITVIAVVPRARPTDAVEDQPDDLVSLQQIERFGEVASRGLVRGDDEQKSVDPFADLAAVRHHHDRRRVDQDVVVEAPRLSHQHLKPRRHEQLVELAVWTAGGQH